MSNIYKKPFKNPHIDVEEVLEIGGSTQLDWFYDEVEHAFIEKILPGCGCTANIAQLADRIRATYTDETKVDAFKDAEELKLTKTLTVFYRDGKPLQVTNNRGNPIWNPDKESDILTFTVTVKRKS